jgi:hypothetical protein
MNTWYQEVRTSIEKNQTWTPSIPMPPSVWLPSDFPLENNSQTNNGPTKTATDETAMGINTDISMENTNTSTVNVIDIIFLYIHYDKIKAKLNQISFINSYPDNAIFQFEDYNSFGQKMI